MRVNKYFMERRSLKTQERLISSLVEKATKGDTEAFSQLYDIFFDPLYRYLYYRSNGDSVEDLLETVFLKIWMHLGKYDPSLNGSRPPFSAWVFRIAHNVLIDFYRSHRPVESIPEDHPDSRREHSSTDLAVRKLQKESLKLGLKNLKPSYQQIIILKFINDLSNEEISHTLGKSENSLRILQYRALKALRKELEKLGITEYEA